MGTGAGDPSLPRLGHGHTGGRPSEGTYLGPFSGRRLLLSGEERRRVGAGAGYENAVPLPLPLLLPLPPGSQWLELQGLGLGPRVQQPHGVEQERCNKEAQKGQDGPHGKAPRPEVGRAGTLPGAAVPLVHPGLAGVRWPHPPCCCRFTGRSGLQRPPPDPHHTPQRPSPSAP